MKKITLEVKQTITIDIHNKSSDDYQCGFCSSFPSENNPVASGDDSIICANCSDILSKQLTLQKLKS